MTDKKHKYSNDKLTVHFDANVCIHSKVCVNGMPEVFNTKEKPWVNMQVDAADEIADQVKKCPSGALSIEWNEQKPESKFDSEKLTSIKASKDGPYIIEGSFRYYDADGNLVLTKDRIALCRCGQSGNKPFCDGTHKKVGFKS